MVFEVVGLSLLIGKLRGGSIRNLEKLNVKGWYFFIIAFIMEFISILAVGSIQGSLSRFIINNVFIIHTTIYISHIRIPIKYKRKMAKGIISRYYIKFYSYFCQRRQNACINQRIIQQIFI